MDTTKRHQSSILLQRAEAYLIQADDELDFDTGVPPDLAEYPTIVGGIRIRGERSVDFDRRPSFGTLGCFALTTGKDAGKRVLLTNHHVLADPFNELNGPSCTGCTKGDTVGNPDVGRGIATVLRGTDDEFMDAAIAVLNSGTEFRRQIVNDLLASQRESITGSRPLTAADKGLAVHKRGHRTKLTQAIVGDVGVPSRAIKGKVKQNQIRIDLPEKVTSQTPITVTIEAGNTIFVPSVDFNASHVVEKDVAWLQGSLALGNFRITQVGVGSDPHRIVVAADPALTPGGPAQIGFFVTPPLFALKGDSGSVLLDPQGKVVGLVWAAFPSFRIGNAWATPIEAIETRLRISIDPAAAVEGTQIAPRISGDGGAAVVPGVERSRPAAAAFGAVPGAAEPITLRARVEQDLLPLPRGRAIYDLYFRHHLEIRELLDTNRRVAVVWHRQCGPGILQSVLDAVRSRESAIPTSLRGKSWAERVGAILAVFDQHGSDKLRGDIARFGAEVTALGGMTYPRFLATLGA